MHAEFDPPWTSGGPDPVLAVPVVAVALRVARGVDVALGGGQREGTRCFGKSEIIKFKTFFDVAYLDRNLCRSSLALVPLESPFRAS